MCIDLSVYFCIVVYTSTLLVFTLLEVLLHFHSRSSLTRFTKACPRVLSPFNQLNTFPRFFCDDWRRQRCLFALLPLGRTYRRKDGWIFGCRKRNSHLSITLYIFVYATSTADSFIRSSTGCLNIARIYRESHRQLIDHCTQHLIVELSNYGRVKLDCSLFTQSNRGGKL
jgi:hypothetical protein